MAGCKVYIPTMLTYAVTFAQKRRYVWRLLWTSFVINHLNRIKEQRCNDCYIKYVYFVGNQCFVYSVFVKLSILYDTDFCQPAMIFHSMITSSNGNIFRITGRLGGGGTQRSPVNSPHKGQGLGTLMFSLICARISGWVNNREAGFYSVRCYTITCRNNNFDSSFSYK